LKTHWKWCVGRRKRFIDEIVDENDFFKEIFRSASI